MYRNRFNLRKVIAIAICLAVFSVGNVLAQDSTTDQGVVINGVKWATRNVDLPGTFAANPEDAGKFYQWNRKVAWPAMGSVSNWNKSNPTGTVWQKTNNPSPSGWRVPTVDEIVKLLDTDKVSNEWVTVNDVTGRKFTDKASDKSIFLPAAASRDITNGEQFATVGEYGYYWSSTSNGSTAAVMLEFSRSDYEMDLGSSNRGYGLSVRCVSE